MFNGEKITNALIIYICKQTGLAILHVSSSTFMSIKKELMSFFLFFFMKKAVVSEIELLWCTPGERHNRKNNPMYIYYIANLEAVRMHRRNLLKENEALLKQMDEDEEY
jgi:hypothetical protein